MSNIKNFCQFLFLETREAKKQDANVITRKRDAHEKTNNYCACRAYRRFNAMYFSKYCLLTNIGVVKDPLLVRLFEELVPLLT